MSALSILASCNKDGGEPEPASMAIELNYAGEPGAFDISFTPSDNVTEIRYAVASAVQQSLDELKAAFDDGSLKDIESFAPDGENTVSVVRDTIGPYYVLAKGISDKGVESETAAAQIMATGAGFTVDAYDLAAMDITPTIYDADQAYSGMLVVSKMVLGEIGMSIEELLEMYALFGMVPYAADGESMTVALNGDENYDYIMGVVGFDADGMPVSYGSFSFKSGSPDESLPLPEPLAIEAYDIGETQASVKYTMGENTRAYYQMITTLDYAAVYGYTLFADDDYVWEGLDPGTDYVAFGCPMNGNGIFGYGEMTIEEFTTAGDPPATTTSTSAVTAKPKIKAARPVTVESAREFLKSVR